MTDYQLIRSNRRTIALQITRDARVVVRAPLRASEADIRRFVESHRAWLESHLDRQRAAEQAYSTAHSQYTEMQTALADYDRVELQYRTWSRAWMHDENSPVYVPVDRMEVLDLVQEYLMPYGTVNTLVVDEDVMIVTMSGMNLEQISAMFQRLQLQPAVKAATLTLAATPSVNPGDKVDFSITVTLRSAAEREAAQ